MSDLLIENILLSVVLVGLIHELGHYAAALCYGERLKFTFAWGWIFGRIPIPRWIWYMPTRLPLRDKRIIAVAGFGLEVFAGFPLLSAGLYAYPIVVLLHIALYPFYAGNSSDFKWFANRRRGNVKGNIDMRRGNCGVFSVHLLLLLRRIIAVYQRGGIA